MALASVSVSSSFGWNSLNFLLQGLHQQKRSSLFHTAHFEEYLICIFLHQNHFYQVLIIMVEFWLHLTTSIVTFRLPANIYNESFCITAGAFTMFPARGCVSRILPRERTRKYCPWRRISLYSPLCTGSVLDNMISVDHIIKYQPCCQWIPRITSL